MAAVKGREAIRDALRRGAERMTALRWEIRHIIADHNIVMTERVDHFLMGDSRISVPCVATFELRNGKITAWRDYWDSSSSKRRYRAVRQRVANGKPEPIGLAST
jgi:limonene-1,2-epoxide hydrolase